MGRRPTSRAATLHLLRFGQRSGRVAGHLGVRQAVLAGMSQGGYLSLRCALTHPDLVRALVLINTQAPPEQPEKMAGHEVLMKAWMENGLSDEIAGVVAHIILGDGWAGAPAVAGKVARVHRAQSDAMLYHPWPAATTSATAWAPSQCRR